MTVLGWDTRTRIEIFGNIQTFRVILSVVEESRGNETALYTRHLTSFRYREIATPSKSARNDRIVLMRLTVRCFGKLNMTGVWNTHTRKLRYLVHNCGRATLPSTHVLLIH